MKRVFIGEPWVEGEDQFSSSPFGSFIDVDEP